MDERTDDTNSPTQLQSSGSSTLFLLVLGSQVGQPPGQAQPQVPRLQAQDGGKSAVAGQPGDARVGGRPAAASQPAADSTCIRHPRVAGRAVARLFGEPREMVGEMGLWALEVNYEEI